MTRWCTVYCKNVILASWSYWISEHEKVPDGDGRRVLIWFSGYLVKSSLAPCSVRNNFYYHLIQFWFLFIGQEPTMRPANNKYKYMVCSCIHEALSKGFFLQIIFCSIVATLLGEQCWQISFLICQSMIKIWKQTWQLNDKTIIELCYCKILWFMSTGTDIHFIGHLCKGFFSK